MTEQKPNKEKKPRKVWHQLTFKECNERCNGAVWIKFQVADLETKGLKDVTGTIAHFEKGGYDIPIKTSLSDEQKVKNAYTKVMAAAKRLNISSDELQE